MRIPFTLPVIILGALMAQGVFATLLLSFRPANRTANRYLALLVFFLALWLGDAFFRVAEIYQQTPDFYFLPIYYSLAFGPLIYFYTRTLTEPDFGFGWRQVWHFLPAALQGAGYFFLQTQSYSFRRDFWFHIHRPYTYDAELILSLASLITYLTLGWRQIKAYRQRVDNYYSSLHRITLNWLSGLHGVLAFLAAFWLVEAAGRLIWAYYPATPFSAISIGTALLFLAAGGILQQDLKSVAEALPPAEPEPSASAHPVDAGDQAALARLQGIMVDQALYQRQELTLRDFAQALDMPPREVSRLINQGLGVSFIDFVNQHRVVAVKARLEAGDAVQLSLLGIAEAAGFNSKSTFYRVFRKIAGQSPADYLKEVSKRALGPADP
ncbi:MAG: AraC family transcriptional regulator [Bacteroidetes bacterium]|nr:MAG: AraC family transcriptional regulator [Bacteroidota bacterium]